MTPDDPRHGTPAGNSQHKRDGEQPCEPCWKAKLRADKRLRLHGSSRVPLSEEAWAIVRDNPVWIIAKATGISECAIKNIRTRQGNLRVNPDTEHRILTANLVTPIGLRRRVQALAALGWAGRDVARIAGVNVDNVLKLRDGRERYYVRRDFEAAILTAWTQLHMKQPTPSRWATAQKNRAARCGWPPPLAWDDIDNPDENPQDWHYKPADRATALAELVARGDGISDACRVLHTSRDALEKWCARNDRMTDLHVLVGREHGTTSTLVARENAMRRWAGEVA